MGAMGSGISTLMDPETWQRPDVADILVSAMNEGGTHGAILASFMTCARADYRGKGHNG